MFSCCSRSGFCSRRSKAPSMEIEEDSPVYYEKIYNVTRKRWATHIRGQNNPRVICEDNGWEMNDIIVGFYTFKGVLHYEALHVPDRYVLYMLYSSDCTDEYPPIIVIDRESNESMDVEISASESEDVEEESESESDSSYEDMYVNRHIIEFLESCIDYEMAGSRNFYKVATYRCAMKYVKELQYRVSDPEEVRIWPDTPGWEERFSHGTCDKIAEFLEGIPVKDICIKKAA
jgi:hypothetical protein